MVMEKVQPISVWVQTYGCSSSAAVRMALKGVDRLQPSGSSKDAGTNMRIAQISTLHERVPPIGYGGTERVVHYLTEELVRRGHEVVLFASGDSLTSAQLCPCVPQALRLGGASGDPTVHDMIQLDHVIAQLDSFDVLHFHNGHYHFPIAELLGVPHLSTIHGPLHASEQRTLYDHFDQVPLVSISATQRLPVPAANWLGTVYHGLPTDLYHYEANPEPYLVFVGRVSPEKRLDRAIAIATAVGLPLKVAAKIDPVDAPYYHAQIEPLLHNNPLVEFVGEVDDAGKQELLSHALALLFPIDWPEPFGLVMIEANACGTPVIAWRNGSTPEIIREGVNGFLVESIEGAIAAVRQVEQLDRSRVRSHFEVCFSVGRQAEDYEQLYRHLIQARRSHSPAHRMSVHA
jgi:glycosyltransferase involved in cell wall biosynthesis